MYAVLYVCYTVRFVRNIYLYLQIYFVLLYLSDRVAILDIRFSFAQIFNKIVCIL